MHTDETLESIYLEKVKIKIVNSSNFMLEIKYIFLTQNFLRLRSFIYY